MVSIVIPTHNRSELLKRSVRSVLKQTYTDFEIIVISDGSTDNTDIVMEDLCKTDARIHFISYKPSRGGNTARNIGIKESAGKYIAFLDDDDEWLPCKLEKQLRIFESNDEIGLIYTGLNAIYVDEKVKYRIHHSDRGDLSREILKGNMIGSTTTVVMRAEIFKSVGEFDENLFACQDYDLWIRACQITKVGVVEEPCANYYNYKVSGQISCNVAKNEEAYKYINAKYAPLFSQLAKKEIDKMKVDQKLAFANMAMRSNKKKESRRFILESIMIMLTTKSIVFFVLSFFRYRLLLRLWKLLN